MSVKELSCAAVTVNGAPLTICTSGANSQLLRSSEAKRRKLKLALGNDDDVYDVAGSRSRTDRSPIWSCWDSPPWCRQVALRIVDVQALRPGVVGQQAEGRREAMLESRYHAVVVGEGVVADEHRAGAAALILVALSGIQRSQIKTRSLIGGRGARCSGCSGLDCGGTCGNDTRATCATCTPDSGNVIRAGPSQRNTHGRMEGMAPDVLELELPASAKLTLNACCPRFRCRKGGTGAGENNVLRLREELRRQPESESEAGEMDWL